MSARFHTSTFAVFLILAVMLAGCLGGGNQGTPGSSDSSADLEYTQAAETIFAKMTEEAPPATSVPEQLPETQPADKQVATEAPAPTATEALPPTSTPLPSNTPLPTDTPEPTDTLEPTDTPEPSATATSPEPEFVLVYEDDLSLPSGWPVETGDTFRLRYQMGGYSILVKTPNISIWSVRSEPFVNVRVEVEGMRLSGPRDGYYGVVCRFENGSNYYILVVGSNGSYAIAKKIGGVLNVIAVGGDQDSLVLTGAAPNHIRGDCVGNTLTLYVNGEEAISVEDFDFTAGAVGMVAGTNKTGDYEVLFDNITVYELQK